MGITRRPRFRNEQRTRRPSDTRNYSTYFASELQAFVGIQRHRSLSVENSCPIQSVYISNLCKHWNSIIWKTRSTYRNWLGKNWIGYFLFFIFIYILQIIRVDMSLFQQIKTKNNLIIYAITTIEIVLINICY